MHFNSNKLKSCECFLEDWSHTLLGSRQLFTFNRILNHRLRRRSKYIYKLIRFGIAFDFLSLYLMTMLNYYFLTDPTSGTSCNNNSNLKYGLKKILIFILFFYEIIRNWDKLHFIFTFHIHSIPWTASDVWNFKWNFWSK